MVIIKVFCLQWICGCGRCGGYDHEDVSAIPRTRVFSELHRLGVWWHRLVWHPQGDGSTAERHCDMGKGSLW